MGLKRQARASWAKGRLSNQSRWTLALTLARLRLSPASTPRVLAEQRRNGPWLRAPAGCPSGATHARSASHVNTNAAILINCAFDRLTVAPAQSEEKV